VRALLHTAYRGACQLSGHFNARDILEVKALRVVFFRWENITTTSSHASWWKFEHLSANALLFGMLKANKNNKRKLNPTTKKQAF